MPSFRVLRNLVIGCALAIPCGWPVHALTLGFPELSERVTERVEPYGSYALPIGPWDDGSMLTSRTEGRIAQSAWRVADPKLTTLAMIVPMRKALESDGWRVLYDCETQSCGGFDFRYSTQVLPEPDMHVDLGDFRFLSARKGIGAAAEYASFLVSRSSGAGVGYIQMIQITPQAAPDLPDRPPVTAPAPSDVARQLEESSVVLGGLRFETGAAGVVIDDDSQLKALVAYLESHPDSRISLVGHTDASGGVDANLALSARRASALRDRLVKDFNAPARRITALGAGFLAPRASNQTEEGRALNRRVEAILTSTP